MSKIDRKRINLKTANTQLINAVGYLDGWKRLMKHFNGIILRQGKLAKKEFKILVETGVLSNIGLYTATGYDRNQNWHLVAYSAGSANLEQTSRAFVGSIDDFIITKKVLHTADFVQTHSTRVEWRRFYGIADFDVGT